MASHTECMLWVKADLHLLFQKRGQLVFYWLLEWPCCAIAPSLQYLKDTSSHSWNKPNSLSAVNSSEMLHTEKIQLVQQFNGAILNKRGCYSPQTILFPSRTQGFMFVVRSGNKMAHWMSLFNRTVRFEAIISNHLQRHTTRSKTGPAKRFANYHKEQKHTNLCTRAHLNVHTSICFLAVSFLHKEPIDSPQVPLGLGPICKHKTLPRSQKTVGGPELVNSERQMKTHLESWPMSLRKQIRISPLN